MNLFSLEPLDYQKLLLSVGSHRVARPLTPVEVAELFNRMIEAGATLKDCAKAVHLDGTSMISRFLRLTTLEPSIRHNIDWGSSGATIGFTAASELARLPPADQPTARDAILGYALSSAEIKQLVQLRSRSRSSIDECIDQTLRLRPTFERRHILLGAVASPDVRAFLKTLTSQERDEILSAILTTILGSTAAISTRLGIDRFTIVANEEAAPKLYQLEPDFETAINAELVRRV